MTRTLPFLLALAACGQSPFETNTVDTSRPAPARPAEVTFQAADGVTIHGNFYPAQDPKALILLFHQAGANRAEYADIAPRLAAEGYSALAIDQRSGGTMFGTANETVVELGKSQSYDAARQDIEAAIDWAEGQKLPVLLLGSSYSAAVATLVAADHPELTGVLLFSPGEYLEDRSAVMAAAGRLSMPLFVTSARDADEVADARALVAAAPTREKVLFLPTVGGAHGASSLRADTNSKGADGVWTAMNAFLARVAPGTSKLAAR